MEYQTVQSSAYQIDEKINALIKKGWTPLGGVSVWIDQGDGSIYYVQAMIRERK